MPRKRKKLPPGEHRAFVLTVKRGEKIFTTPGCCCGWRGEETSSRTTALDRFDKHVEELKRGEAPAG